MFSLDSNAMLDLNGQPLKHFTPYPSPASARVDAFSQKYLPELKYYAFSPFNLIAAVGKFTVQEHINATLVFPDFYPCEP